MSDLVGNPEDRFSRVAAHIIHRAHSNVSVEYLGMERLEITLVKIIPYRQLHQDVLYFSYLVFTMQQHKINEKSTGLYI